MNAVGDRTDGHLVFRPSGKERLEDVAAHLAVKFANTIDPAAAADSEIGHIKGIAKGIAGAFGSHFQQVLERDAEFLLSILMEILVHELGIKTVEARGDRGVGGEQISWAGNGQRKLEGHLVIFHVAACTFENGERSMAFVQVAHLGLQADSPQQTPAADTQDDLLLEPHFRVTAIEFAGNAALGSVVGEIVGVQKIEFVPAHADFPAAKPDLRLGELNLYS